MEKVIKRIKNEFSLNPDLNIKEIKLNLFKTIYIIFLETLSGSDKVNNYVLKPLTNQYNQKVINKRNLNNFLAGPNQVTIKNDDEIEFYLTNGFTVVIFEDVKYAIETKADLTRSIAPNEVQTAINGPKDGFTENYQTNIGLIKRRIKSSHLKIESRTIGRLTNTLVSVLYIDDIAEIELIDNVLSKLDKIDIDGIIDSSSISFLIEDENKSIFPTVKYSERPDDAVIELLRGKIVIVVDTSPFVLIIPSFFIDFLNPISDNYTKSNNISFLKILRIIIFGLGIVTPAFFNALLCYNPESIPMAILVNFAIQREGVPFPLIIETIMMLLVCDILKESDLRFPSSFGSSISILGAIVLGQASVEAGLVSPIIIIVVAITFIASLTFTDLEIANGIRCFTYVFLFASAFLGLYGIFLAFMFFLIYLTSIDSFTKPYFFPFAPYDKVYFKNTVLKSKIKNDKKRSRMLTKKNIIKQGEN